jgi:hypothetical protein
VLRFFLTAGLILSAAAVAWAVSGPAVTRGLAALAAPALPDRITVEPAGADLRLLARAAQGEATAEWTMHPLTALAGPVLAAAALLAMPGPSYRRRLAWLLGVAALCGVLFSAGMAMLGSQLGAIADGRAEPGSMAGPSRLVTYAWLFAPSMVWAPLLFRQLGPGKR